MIPSLSFQPPVIAHRGAGCDAPENTLAAIRSAHAQGARWIEVDIKITYDGVPILMHDETLDRTTSGTGLVAEAKWADVQNLKIVSDLRSAVHRDTVPSLAQAVKLVLELDMSLVAEIKPCAGRAKATTMVAIIELAKMWPERERLPLIASFDIESLQVAAQLEPHWPRCLLLEAWDEDWQQKAAQAQAVAVNIREDQLTQERVAAFVRQRVPLLSYTVNDPARAKELLAWGVSAVYAGCPRTILDRL